MKQTQFAKAAFGPKPNMTEIGATGLTVMHGQVEEEWLRQLMGSRRLKAFREMVENDDIVGACFYAIEQLLRGVEWHAEPAEGEAEDSEQVEYLDTLFTDMSHSWSDFISEWMTCPAYGFAPFEIVYKMRQGPNRAPGKASRYSDGLVGIRKLAIRHPDTINRWVFDDQGGVQSLEQIAPPSYRPTMLPIEKLLLFRVRTRKGNPEGTPLLRNAYISYMRKKRIAEIEAIGTERNLAGLPIMYTPAHWHMSDASSSDQALLTEAKKIVRNLRTDEQGGVILPSVFDPDTKERLLKLELLAVGGGASVKNVDLSPVIERYDRRIAMTILADVILIGHEAVGSFALASSKTNLFSAGLGALLDGISDVLNRHLLPRLWAMNGWSTENMPMLRHGDIENIPLDEVTSLIEKLSGAGAPLFPDDDLENHLRRLANLPPVPEDRQERLEQEREYDLQRTELELQGLEAANRAAGQPPDKPGKPGQPGKPGKPVDKKYNPDQPRVPAGSGDPSGEWTDDGETRTELAVRTHKPSTLEKQRLALAHQRDVALAIGGDETEDNKPLDVLMPGHGVEVKAIMDNNNDKITVHPASRRRKEAYGKKHGVKLHTIVVDTRNGRLVYYYKQGVGAFRLGGMEQIPLKHLRGRILR